MKLVIGSRGSQLALWQAHWVQSRLKELRVESEIKIIKTTGDKITDVPLAQVGSKGLFTKEIEEALLASEIDLAVHSLKDLPTVLPEGLTLAAIPEREIPYDALVGRTLADLPLGARVGTSSMRRASHLKKLRPDLVIESLRGNLDTRLRKLDEGQYDAILLAGAGLRRLGLADRISELLPPEAMCPAVGQGALAIETRASGDALRICSQLDHPATRAAVTAERAVLRRLGGGCQVPIGALAVIQGGSLQLRAVVIDPSNGEILSDVCSGPIREAEKLGSASGRRLLERGARRVLKGVYGQQLPLAGQLIVVTRAKSQADGFAEKLRAEGADVIELPVLSFVAENFETPDLEQYDWAIFTSANGVVFFCERVKVPDRVKICAIGPGTASALRQYGIEPAIVAADAIAEGVVAAFAGEDLAGRRILLPRAKSGRELIPEELAKRGALVDVLPVYRTVVPPELAGQARHVFEDVQPDWVTLASSSALEHLLGATSARLLSGVHIATIGPVTSESVRASGLSVTVEAQSHTMDGMLQALTKWVAEHESA
jgi:hydroxymethylbilane synthase